MMATAEKSVNVKDFAYSPAELGRRRYLALTEGLQHSGSSTVGTDLSFGFRK